MREACNPRHAFDRLVWLYVVAVELNGAREPKNGAVCGSTRLVGAEPTLELQPGLA